MAVSWITAIAFLFVLPEQIPMHLNPYVAGGIGRFGSKFECLIFPAAATIVGALFLLAARNRGKKDDIAEEKAFVLSSLPAMAIFFFMELFCMLGGLAQ